MTTEHTDSTRRPNRKSHRLRGFDYSLYGAYFITICTRDHAHLFGDVGDNEMTLSPYGEIASNEWTVSVDMRKEIYAHAFVVMPNHVHGLISIIPPSDRLSFERDNSGPRLVPRSLGAFVNGYTGAVTRTIKKRHGDPDCVVWQRNYYDHIVRDEADFESILAYIDQNPARWDKDRFNREGL
jgi:REP element-mobilizing transposase RayT